MSDLIRMKALKPWLNVEHEGNISDGQEFEALEDRARELERNGFAVRITITAPEDKVQKSPVEFARKDVRGEPARPSRSRRRPDTGC